MKKGQIVRRMLKDGTPIGPFLICDKVKGKRVFTHSIDPFTRQQITLTISHTYVCKVVKLYVSEKDIKHLINNLYAATQFKHKPTKTWLNASKDDWDVVILQNRPVSQRIYYVDCTFRRMIKKTRKSRVINSAEKIYFEIEPYVKIYFGRFIHAEET